MTSSLQIFLFCLMFSIISCAGTSPELQGQTIQLKVASEKLSRGAVLIDVRSEEEYQLGHISGARNIPVEELLERAHELGGNRLQSIVVYSDDDKRANMALNTLYELGYENVLNAGSYQRLSQHIERN